MNLSGESLRPIMDFYKLDLSDILVIYDDISLEPGMLRLRYGRLPCILHYVLFLYTDLLDSLILQLLSFYVPFLILFLLCLFFLDFVVSVPFVFLFAFLLVSLLVFLFASVFVSLTVPGNRSVKSKEKSSSKK